MFTVLSEGFLLGLSTGVYCLTSCLPLLVPYILSEGDKLWKNNFAIFLEFLSGRFIAYFIFAVLASLLGKVSKTFVPAWFLPLAMTGTAAAMVFFVFAGNGSGGGVCLGRANRLFKRLPLAMGFVTGINLCPPFVAAFVRLVGLADISSGLLYFAGFFTASSLFLLPAVLPTPLLGERTRAIGKMTLLIAGVWYLFLGLRGLLAL